MSKDKYEHITEATVPKQIWEVNHAYNDVHMWTLLSAHPTQAPYPGAPEHKRRFVYYDHGTRLRIFSLDTLYMLMRLGAAEFVYRTKETDALETLADALEYSLRKVNARHEQALKREEGDEG